MLFSLSSELEEWQRKMRELTKEKIAPGAEQREETEQFPWDMADLLRKEGILSLCYPKKYGGGEASLLQLCVGVEEICRACNNTAVFIIYHAMANFALQIAGNDSQKAKYYPRLMEGRTFPTFVLTDSSGGSDVASMKTTAELRGNEYILNGVKRFISSADGASIFVIYAKTDPTKNHRGISAFLLDKEPGEEIPGLTIKRQKLISMHSSDACIVEFNDFHIPRENLLGKVNDGFYLAMKSLDFSRPLVASRALGTAQGALDCAVEYAKKREAFGQPIAAFQAIQFMLADMATEVMAARQLVYKAAANYDQGKGDQLLYASMAKKFASDIAMKVTTNAVQILGGNGVTRDLPAQRLMKDAKIIQIVEGTTQIQQMVIARKLLGKH